MLTATRVGEGVGPAAVSVVLTLPLTCMVGSSLVAMEDCRESSVGLTELAGRQGSCHGHQCTKFVTTTVALASTSSYLYLVHAQVMAD